MTSFELQLYIGLAQISLHSTFWVIAVAQTCLLPAEKSVDHKEGSLGFLVNNLVKNWEKEASYKVKGSRCLSVAFV
jgi:hypothetical protein